MKAYTLTPTERRRLVSALHIAVDEYTHWANRLRRSEFIKDTEINRLVESYERQAAEAQAWETKLENAVSLVMNTKAKGA